MDTDGHDQLVHSLWSVLYDLELGGERAKQLVRDSCPQQFPRNEVILWQGYPISNFKVPIVMTHFKDVLYFFDNSCILAIKKLHVYSA